MKHERIIKFETALDHLSGEELGMAIRALNEMPEVLDALYLTGIGKKNRPAGLLQVLCSPEHEEAVCMAIFRHTHTLGTRRQEMERLVLPRREEQVAVAGRNIAAKAYELEENAYLRPEADAIQNLAEKESLGAPAFRFARKNWNP